MSESNVKKVTDKKQYTFNLALAAVASQVGCVTIVIVVGTLILGLWLDRQLFDTFPLFTAILMVASVPITVILMLWIVRSATSRIRPSTDPISENSQEDSNRGTEPN